MYLKFGWVFWWYDVFFLSTCITLVAFKRVHVRKKHVLIGCKCDMFWHQTFKVWCRQLLSTWFVFTHQNILCKNFWTLRLISGDKCAVSEQEICLRVEKNEIWAECASQNKIINLPLVRPFGLMAVKLEMFGGKTRHVATLFVSCPCLDASDGIVVCRFQYIFLGVIQCMLFLLVDNGFWKW